MGYRLSGGLIFKMIEPLMGINDMKMMIRYALGGEMITEEEIKRLDMNFSGKCGAQLMISLSAGKISKIIGLDEALQMSGVCDFIQYYNVGDIVEDSYIGTLQQLFGRFTLVGDSKEHLKILIDKIQNGISVLDDHGKEMANMKFDMTRAR